METERKAVQGRLFAALSLRCIEFVACKPSDTEGKFHFVAVVQGVDGTDGRLYGDARETTDPFERIRHLLTFEFQLTGIGKMLPYTSPARAEIPASRGYTMGRRCHYCRNVRLSEIFAHPG
jgi:hypothetical protein